MGDATCMRAEKKRLSAQANGVRHTAQFPWHPVAKHSFHERAVEMAVSGNRSVVAEPSVGDGCLSGHFSIFQEQRVAKEDWGALRVTV